MKAVLVDDDIHFCGIFLARLQDSTEKLGIRITCDTCHEPEYILQHSVVYDIYFLDIEMNGMNGLELAKELRARFVNAEIIFLSFHEQYVWQAFHVRPAAFIRKAQMETDLPMALEVIARQNEKKNARIELPGKGNQIDKVAPMDVLYCRSEEHYVRFIWRNGEDKLYRMKLTQAEELLSKHRFIRTHSRYLINSEYIQGISTDKIVLVNEQEIPVSRAYKRKIHMTVMNLSEQRKGMRSG